MTIILADGKFPEHKIPLGHLSDAEHIICCDGSAENLLEKGIEPEAIVGDLDSLSDDTISRFCDRLFMDTDQETNDLTKAVHWCSKKGYNDIVILGATGRREDHTIGNISLLAEYARFVRIKMVTDTGTFIPLLKSCEIESYPRQQVSIFCADPETKITSAGLKYKLQDMKLGNWWRATLNEAEGYSFRISFTGGPVLVYLAFGDV